MGPLPPCKPSVSPTVLIGLVVAGPTIEDIGPGLTPEGVVAVTAHQHVVTAAVDTFGTWAATP